MHPMFWPVAIGMIALAWVLGRATRCSSRDQNKIESTEAAPYGNAMRGKPMDDWDEAAIRQAASRARRKRRDG